MKRAVAVSLFLHLSVLLLCFRCGLGGSKTSPSGKADAETSVDFVPKPSEVVDVSPVDVKDDGERTKRRRVKKEDCKDSYGGIGIGTAGPDERGDHTFQYLVTKVAPGYAADRAGVKPFDTIQSLEDVKGEPGTTVQIILIHHDSGRSESLVLTREQICTKPGELSP